MKFIVTCDWIVFGDRPFGGDMHTDVARRNGIPKTSVRGGGLSDLTERRIFGTSYGFGSYDPEAIRALLPDWQIAEPSDY
ncbi:MAG: hypothetical protein HYW79_00650 [Parcubacteria group bacterium]|nr:hypothetical protein [Parcubacteria group bacterium]